MKNSEKNLIVTRLTKLIGPECLRCGQSLDTDNVSSLPITLLFV